MNHLNIVVIIHIYRHIHAYLHHRIHYERVQHTLKRVNFLKSHSQCFSREQIFLDMAQIRNLKVVAINHRKKEIYQDETVKQDE